MNKKKLNKIINEMVYEKRLIEWIREIEQNNEWNNEYTHNCT